MGPQCGKRGGAMPMHSLRPVGEILTAELGDQLDTPSLRLDLPALFASDITGRARAFAAMVQAGMDVERAAALSGLLAGE